MALDLGKAREVFDDFLTIMDDQIEWLVDQGHSRGIDLDGSLESLDRLEFLYALMSAALSKDEQGALRVVF
ncbi:TPA: hypothetical protein R4K21_004483, partial [Stenotrophomonas maltophilia]|nr:hypothetical protein [Stenotrophomonas maltophilia]